MQRAGVTFLGAAAETARLLTVLEQEFSLIFEDLEFFPEYAQFVKSRHYREWLDSRTPLLAQ